jgi:hypothetical protein
MSPSRVKIQLQKEKAMAILTHKLLITNKNQKQKVVGVYDSEKDALNAKGRHEACFPTSTFKVVENR